MGLAEQEAGQGREEKRDGKMKQEKERGLIGKKYYKGVKITKELKFSRATISLHNLTVDESPESFQQWCLQVFHLISTSQLQHLTWSCNISNHQYIGIWL